MSVLNILGLDLGQVSDPTSLAVLRPSASKQAEGPVYHVLGLKRWPLRTAYMKIASDLAGILSRSFPRQHYAEAPLVIVDTTGVGRGVFEMLQNALLRSGCRPVLFGVTITSGLAINVNDFGEWKLSKTQLVSAFQCVLQSRRLKVAAKLAEAPQLIKEMRTFRQRVTASATQTFNAEGKDKDDLLFATMLAVWLAENCSDEESAASSRPMVIRA